MLNDKWDHYYKWWSMYNFKNLEKQMLAKSIHTEVKAPLWYFCQVCIAPTLITITSGWFGLTQTCYFIKLSDIMIIDREGVKYKPQPVSWPFNPLSAELIYGDIKVIKKYACLFNCFPTYRIHVLLTRCGLVTPYVDRDLCQHRLTWYSLSSDGTKPLPNQCSLIAKGFRCIYMRAILQEVHVISI